MIDALQQSHAKLSKQVRILEQERQHHLTIIDRLKEYAPQHVLRILETEQSLITQLSTDSAISVSSADSALLSDNHATSSTSASTIQQQSKTNGAAAVLMS